MCIFNVYLNFCTFTVVFMTVRCVTHYVFISKNKWTKIENIKVSSKKNYDTSKLSVKIEFAIIEFVQTIIWTKITHSIKLWFPTLDTQHRLHAHKYLVHKFRTACSTQISMSAWKYTMTSFAIVMIFSLQHFRFNYIALLIMENIVDKK